MMGEVLGEAFKSVKIWWRQRLLVVMGFMVPFVLTFFFIQAFNIGSGGGFPLAVVDQENGSDVFIQYLGSEQGTIPYFKVQLCSEATAMSLFNARKVFAVVYIPYGFSEHLENGEPMNLPVYINNIHEDLSKNLRLGIEGRVYEYIKAVDLAQHPGVDYHVSLEEPVELRRVDYMQMGIMVFNSMFLGFLLGGTLGAMEKDQGTIRTVLMSPYGYVYSRLGKIVASMAITLFIVSVNLLLNRYLYGLVIADYRVFYCVCLMLSCMFSTVGVTYGFFIGTFTLVPVPSILLSFTFWIISGAINPIEFSAGSRVFMYLPSAAAIKILTAVNFGRSTASLWCNIYVLTAWFLLTLLYLGVDSIRRAH